MNDWAGGGGGGGGVGKKTLQVPAVTDITCLPTISIDYQEKRWWELMEWSPKGKRLIDVLFNSPNQFVKEMNGKRSDEFACGSVLGRVKTVFWSSMSLSYNVCINEWKTVHIKIPFFFVVVLTSITFQKSVFSLGDCTMLYHSIDVRMFACRLDVIFSQLSQRGGCLSSCF